MYARLAVFRFLLLAISLPIAAGCGPSAQNQPPGAANTRSAPAAAELTDADRQAIRNALPAAAGCPIAELGRIATSERAPTFDDFESPSFSAVILTLHAFSANIDADPAKLQEDLTFDTADGRFPSPAALASFMVESKEKGFASVIQDRGIQVFECEGNAQAARGKVRVKVERFGTFQAHFQAKREQDAWQIVRFELPAFGVATTLDAGGKWKATGAALEADRVRVPIVKRAGAIDASQPRLLLLLGYYVKDPDLPVAFVQDQMISSARWKSDLGPAIQKWLDARKLTSGEMFLVVRAERNLPASVVVEAVESIATIGNLRMQLSLQTAPDEGSGEETWGELSLAHLPSRRPNPSRDELLPISVRLQSNSAGVLAKATINGQAFREGPTTHQEMEHRFMAYYGAEANPSELAVVFTVDRNLKYSEFVKTAAIALCVPVRGGQARQVVRDWAIEFTAADKKLHRIGVAPELPAEELNLSAEEIFQVVPEEKK